MATGKQPITKSAAPASHPITIVPLYPGKDVTTEQEKAAAPPQLTHRGGPLLNAVQVFTVFWGEAWQQQPQSDLANYLNQFFDFILTSELIDQLKEYSVSGQTIEQGQRIGTVTITDPALGNEVQDSDIQQMLQQQIANNSDFPQPTSNTLYFVYLPPGVQVVSGNSSSCQNFCGYHTAIQAQNPIFYAVMPAADCPGCVGDLASSDALTSTSSHELCEAITDPIPGQGWYDDANGEIGDICAWKTKKVGDFTVQQEWSNQANSCI